MNKSNERSEQTMQEKKPRTLTGVVASAGMNKSIVVLIARTVRHPLYGKYIRRSTRLLAHDEDNACGLGDTVVIQSSRPISKRKAWRLQRIVKRAEKA